MNWEAIGAVGDLIGGLAVVLSLVYVGYQIRQSSKLIDISSRNLEAATYLETADAFSRWWLSVAQDAELVEVWRRGLAEPALPPNEALRFQFLIGALFVAFENNQHQLQIGSVRRDSLRTNRRMVGRILLSPGGSAWWKRVAPHSLTEEFRAEVDQVLAGLEREDAT